MVLRCLATLALFSVSVLGVPHSRVKRVIGGEEIQEGEWPWLVSLQGKIPTLKLFGVAVSHKKIYCGASLLNDHWVLTAAHCFTESGLEEARYPGNWHARIGDIDLDSSLADKFVGAVGDFFDIDEFRKFFVHPDMIIIHPEYDASDLWKNDIALVRLKEEIPHTAEEFSHIQSVELSDDDNFPPDQTQCVMKGWGCNEAGGSVVEMAKATVLPKVSDIQCARYWGIDVRTRLCAGYDLAEKGICSGDSGGPLVCQKPDQSWVQVGIASFTSSTRPGNVPGAFTRVSNYNDWIKETIALNTLEKTEDSSSEEDEGDLWDSIEEDIEGIKEDFKSIKSWFGGVIYDKK